MIALSNPAMFHGAISQAFEGKRPHALWRIDWLKGARYLLLLSDTEPNLDRAIAEYGVGIPAEVKCYDALLSSIEEGATYHFRLRANPTYTTIVPGTKRGRVCAHSTVENQRQWFIEQGKKHGFVADYQFFDVAESNWYRFGKKSGNRVTLLAVTYEGRLTVTDVTLFREAITKGIGRGKAYGMGLLTIMRT